MQSATRAAAALRADRVHKARIKKHNAASRSALWSLLTTSVLTMIGVCAALFRVGSAEEGDGRETAVLILLGVVVAHFANACIVYSVAFHEGEMAALAKLALAITESIRTFAGDDVWQSTQGIYAFIDSSIPPSGATVEGA